MEERGVIVEIKQKTALIKAQRGTACDNCASKRSCHSSTGTEMLIEAENPIGAKPGDHVVFSVGAGSVLKAGLILYLVPILCFIAGVVLGQTIAAKAFSGVNQDLVSGVLGAVFLALAFAGLKLYSRFIEKNKSYRPQVLRVIQPWA